MKKGIYTLLFLLLGLLTITARAQTPADLLLSAMKKCGDWEGVKTLRYHTTGNNYNKWQNYNFQNPRPTADEAFREYDLAGGAYYIKTISRYGGGYVFEFAHVGKDTTRYTWDVLRSRNGKALTRSGKRAFDAGIQLLQETYPYYALKAVLQSRDSLSLPAATTVRRHFKDGSYEDYGFDGYEQLKFIERVQGAQVTRKEFTHYTRQENLSYPKTVRLFLNKELTRVDEVGTMAINQAFNQSLLQLPEGYTIAAPVTASMKVSEIGKDVYLVEHVPGGRNVLFVAMNDYIVVTEAPLTNEVAQSIIDLIHRTVPNKPIKYVHLSHFHNDHCNGIRAFVAEGATVLATPATIAAVKTLIEDRSGRFTDALAKAPRTPGYEVFNKHYSLKDSGHEIRFYEMANTHAQGMSFLYLPTEGIVYQGDLFSLPDDGTITPAIEITRDFHRFIKSNKLPVKRIIGHHGSSAITPKVLAQAVSLKE